ncbi:MAG: hypothetical protein EXQ96_06000 [Alphaproteobacteria bacterium]|nr:hypothetical protein [Alphaproteobacteria bacterium]
MPINLWPTAQTLHVIAKAQASETARATPGPKPAAAEQAPNRAAAFLQARQADQQARTALQRRFQDETLPPHADLQHLRPGSIVDVTA